MCVMILMILYNNINNIIININVILIMKYINVILIIY